MIIEYQALNRSGDIVSSTTVVDDMSGAYAQLNRQGLTPIRIKKSPDNVKGGFDLKTLLQRFIGQSRQADPKRASRRHVPFFTSQMAILLETGTPVAPSLTAIEKQLTDPRWSALVARMRLHVEEGGTLTSAAALYPNVFDSVYTSMISAGEASGNLSQMLNRLAELSRQTDRLRHKLISAMIYPTLLTLIALTAMLVITFFVLPRFAIVFEEMNVKLPETTKTLLAVSDFVRQRILLTIIMASIVIGSIIFWLRSQHGRRFIARSVLKIPVIGPLISSLINARIFRLLGLLVESSVPLLDSLELTIASTKNYLYADLIAKMHRNVLNGKSMHEAMMQNNLVPAGIAQMIHTGENNGQIGKVMSLLADYLDDRNETKIGTLTSVMEPVILIFMGFIVGTLVISLVLPMFDLSQISG